MRVLYDHQIFDSQTVEGPSRYVAEVARHLPPLGVATQFAVVETDNVFLWRDLDRKRRLRPLPVAPRHNARLRRLGVWLKLVPYTDVDSVNRRASVAALRAGAYDVFHPTYYDPYFLPWLGGRPFVLTVHDMIHELFPEYVKLGNPTIRWKRLLVKRAAHIVTVSDCTKRDLVRCLGVSDGRVTAIHHGVGQPFTDPPGAPPATLPTDVREYLLQVGNRGRYKNFSQLLAALPWLCRRYSDLHVVCVGGGEWTPAERTAVARSGLTRRVIRLTTSDDELAALYRHARALVFPSRYEGFGLPLLEAMAAGCPVVASRAGSLPEVAGEAAVYFDPGSAKELARAVARVLDSNDLAERLRTAGRTRAAAFTWDRAARATLRVYERAVLSAVGAGATVTTT